MANFAAPILAGTTLAAPATYEDDYDYRGSGTTMADGSITFDVVDTNYRRTIKMTWVLITDAEKAAILAAWSGLKTADASFTPPEGTAITVTRTEKGPSFNAVKSALGNRWNGSLELRQQAT